MKHDSLRWNDSVEASDLIPGLRAQGGQAVSGTPGLLRIAFNLRALRLRPGEPIPTHWLLPLNHPELVRLAADLPGDVLWLSPTPPRSLAGFLMDDFRGAWWEEGQARILIHGSLETYPVPPGSPDAGSLPALARIVALRWAGRSPVQSLATLRTASPNARSSRSSALRPVSQLALA